MQQRRNRPAIITSLLLVAILGIAVGVFFNAPQTTREGTQEYPTPAALLEQPRPLTPFQLTAHDQKPLDIERLKGKWTLLFFGYTHCPDVCPTTLTELAQTAQQLQPAILKDTQFVFVSVDPQRDTPTTLAEYVGYFDPHFIGATGDLEALAVLVQQLESKFSLSVDPAGEPIVNHSSAILLIDPQVRYYAHLVAPHYADELHEQYLALRNYYLKTNP
jgi:protein SCO1/2